MFKRLLGKLLVKLHRGRGRRLLAERLLISVEQLGAMALDKNALKHLGVGRKLAVRIICILLVRERMHLISDPKGRTIMLSNQEFLRHIDNRVNGFEENLRVSSMPPATAHPDLQRQLDSMTAAGGDQISATENETVCMPGPIPGSGTMDYDWFAIDDKPAPDGTNDTADMSSDRQSLPERRREPWPHTGGGVRENG